MVEQASPDTEHDFNAQDGRQQAEALLVPADRLDALVTERLRPDTETDQAGFDRRIYHLGEVSFMFRGREELPEVPAMQANRTELVAADERPNWTGADDYDRYAAKLAQSQEGPLLLVAPKTPRGVIELARRLGSADPTLPSAAEGLKHWQFDERTLEIIDQIMAASLVGENGELSEQFNQDAEAAVVMALLGDKTASELVAEKVLQMQALDDQTRVNAETRDKLWSDEHLGNIEPVWAEDLACVHATDYEPQVLDDGTVVLRTTGDATGGKYIRDTIHFSLNHKVASHADGVIENRGYIIIAPMEDMIAADGPPDVIKDVDTWWALNPGQSLRLPNARIIEVAPGQDDEALTDEALEQMGRRVLRGGKDYIFDSEMQKRIQKFAAESGIRWGTHAYSDEGGIESGLLVAVSMASELDEKGKITSFDWQQYSPSRETRFYPRQLGTCNPKTRRAVYASGLLPAHSPKPRPVSSSEGW